MKVFTNENKNDKCLALAWKHAADHPTLFSFSLPPFPKVFPIHWSNQVATKDHLNNKNDHFNNIVTKLYQCHWVKQLLHVNSLWNQHRSGFISSRVLYQTGEGPDGGGGLVEADCAHTRTSPALPLQGWTKKQIECRIQHSDSFETNVNTARVMTTVLQSSFPNQVKTHWFWSKQTGWLLY